MSKEFEQVPLSKPPCVGILKTPGKHKIFLNNRVEFLNNVREREIPGRHAWPVCINCGQNNKMMFLNFKWGETDVDIYYLLLPRLWYKTNVLCIVRKMLYNYYGIINGVYVINSQRIISSWPYQLLDPLV